MGWMKEASQTRKEEDRQQSQKNDQQREAEGTAHLEDGLKYDGHR